MNVPRSIWLIVSLFIWFKKHAFNVYIGSSRSKVNNSRATLKTKCSTHLKLCLATATHNFKWVKITHIFVVWEQKFENIDF